VKSLTVVSYNIHKGVSAIKRTPSINDIALSMQSLAPDIICLQEVVGETKKISLKNSVFTANPKITSDIEKNFDSVESDNLIKPNKKLSQYAIIAGNDYLTQCYGKNAEKKNGHHHGNALISSLKIKKWCNLNISTNKFEQRGCLHGEFEFSRETAKSQSLHALCVHLDLLERGRMRQLHYIIEYIESEISREDPLVLAGDFNDWNDQATRILSSHLGVKEVFLDLFGSHALTFPSRLPLLKLDRIYTRGLIASYARVLNEPIWRSRSDHVPIVAVFNQQ
jgi:endonuclease/exonuclease/phosphatase family metal-dependent hydrolase